jgi:hypothetical protein
MNAVISRRFKVLAATVGLWMAHSLPGLASPPDQPVEPSRINLLPGQPLQPAATPANQQLADTIAAALRNSGRMNGYAVDIRVVKGDVELTGTVASIAQRDEALQIVRGVPGVESVHDSLTLVAPVTPVTATTQPVTVEPRTIQPGPVEGPTGPAIGSQSPEPMPIFRAMPQAPGFAGPAAGHMPPPPMPPYAWPTYAPYNNYSRVAYPTLYPYQSWPFIGPVYPFPKVPLGWRSIQLKWEDGHWWYGRTACGHDWWRVRYW